jgi:phosphatidylserine decarboxylase
VAIEIETDRGHGRVTVVMVGALIVGRITATGIAGRDVPSGVHVFDPPIRVERGDEIGRFHLGSTVVLFADNAHALEVVQASGDVRCGRPLLRTPDMGLEASSPDSRSTTDASGGEERGVMG